jgi:hypothetical protein
MKPKSAHHLHFYNLSEDVWPFIQSLSPKARKHELAENCRLAGHEYLGIRAQFVRQAVTFVCPTPINPEYLDYLNRLFPGNVRLAHPQTHSGRLCHDTLKDPDLLASLKIQASLSAYCPSPSLYRLHARFQPSPKLLDLPTQKSWDKVAPFGTKTGLRRLVGSLNDPQITMAPGKIYSRYDQALKAALNYAPSQGFVLKTEKGHAGMGVALFRPGTLPKDPTKRLTAVNRTLLQADGYWHRFPLVLETFIPTNTHIGGGIPNVEGYIDHRGKVSVRYHCGLRVLNNGTFAGTETGPEVLPPKITDQLTYMAIEIGGIYAQHGYRGVFELDTLAGLNGRLYVAESNIRRNGGTHSYNVAQYFFGPDYPKHHHVITHIVTVPENHQSFPQILDQAKDLLFQPGREQGVIPTDPDLLTQNNFGYMVLAETKARAHALETQFLRLLMGR